MPKTSSLGLRQSAEQDLITFLQSRSNSMTPSEQRISRLVLSGAESAATSSITVLAKKAQVSEASVVRFCRGLGFNGYPEFRLALAAELGRRVASTDHEEFDGGITETDSLVEIIRKIGRSDARAIESTVAHLDPKVVAKVIQRMSSASSIGVVGVGASGFVALDLQLKLNRLGRLAVAWTDAHTALTSMAALSKTDFLIAISNSGATADVIDVMAAFKSRGVKSALITNNEKSAAAKVADLVLPTTAFETSLRSGATASRIAQLTVLDCLCVALAHQDLAKTRAALGESRAAVRGRQAPSS